MERRQSGLGRCSMLPISVGLPLILCRKKRPQRRRLKPGSARPRGGSAPAGFAGRAVVDPALPARSPGRAAGATASPGSVSGPRPAGRSGEEGPQTRGARSLPPRPAPLLPASRAAAGSSPGKPCGGAARAARGRKVGAGPARPAAPRGRFRRPPATRPCALSAQRLVPMKPKPQEGKDFGWRRRLNAARLWAVCVPGCCAPGRERCPEAAARSARSGAGCRARGPPPRVPALAAAGKGAARVASRTLNL